jgi:hypothetical protein
MPISGTEAQLASALHAAIEAKMTSVTGYQILRPEWLQAFCEAVAETIIPHLVNNVQVNPGQTTNSSGATGPTASPGSPTPIPALPGTVTTPGDIS